VKAENDRKYGSRGGGAATDGEGDALPEAGADAAEEGGSSAFDDAGDDVASPKEGGDGGGDCDGDGKEDTPHYKLQVLLEQELPECSRREQIDELAEKFCANHGASRPARKRLSRSLFLVPRTRLDLLPHYSRLAAILDRIFPSDVSGPLVTELERQFHGQARFKKNVNLEGRLKTARFLGELTKFRVAPPIVSLRCLRRCLDDFGGANIDVACCLLESCGRYLHRTEHTRARISALMDTMMRIRKAKNLDDRSVAIINSAFFMVSPPQSPTQKRAKVLPPLEAYLKYLFMVSLTHDDRSVSFVSKQVLRFPWSDPTAEVGTLVVKYMLKAVRKGRYKVVGAVADVAANLRRSKPEVPARIVDSALEELQYAMERPSARDQQRTVSHARLLGELHRTGLVPASVVFEQLYRFVNFGHDVPEALREASKKLAAEAEAARGAEGWSVPAATTEGFMAPGGDVDQTIGEDEELEEDDVKKEDEEQEEAKGEPPAAVAVSPHSKYDPRVPCSVDPPTSAFRVKLICTVLETVGASVVVSRSGSNNRAKLDAFLAAFQRYLFIKSMVPSEVEFAVLDLFDSLDSLARREEERTVAASGGGASGAGKKKGGKGSRGATAAQQQHQAPKGVVRYRSWLEAHNATVAIEEAEAAAEARAEVRLLAQAGVSSAGTGAGDADADALDGEDMEADDLLEEEEDSIDDHMSLNSSAKDEDSLAMMSEDESDDDEDSAAGTESDDETSDEDGSDRSDDDSDGDTDEEEVTDDEEEVNEAAAQEAYMKQLEEEAFERELRKITMEALEKGKIAAKTGTGGKVSDSMPAASQISKKTLETGGGSGDVVVAGAPGNLAHMMALGGKDGIGFQLLKKGHRGRVEAKQLVVPSDTNLAKVATKHDDEAVRERDMIKARVLQYESESAEQYSGNVYMEQTKLQVIRNRPLTMDDIDRNFGSSGGDYEGSNRRQQPREGSGDRPRPRHGHSGGRGGGRSGGRLWDGGRPRGGRG